MNKPKALLFVGYLLAATIDSTSVHAATEVKAKVSILTTFPVAVANLAVFNTPLDVVNGVVYTANIEPSVGVPNGINLQAVVRRGTVAPSMEWTQTVIDGNVVDDPWHNAASLIVDGNGRIHVAYNMHSVPWQYSVSGEKGDISNFNFKGERLSLSDLFLVKGLGFRPSYTVDGAAIPGTRITYPAFFRDRDGNIYVTYRFALKPKRTGADQQYSCGMARYEAQTGQWVAIGGPVETTANDADSVRSGPPIIQKPFCVEPVFRGFAPALWFAADGKTLHAAWLWADYNISKPSMPYHVGYARSLDGGKTFQSGDAGTTSLPFTPETAAPVARNALLSGDYLSVVATQKGVPLILLQTQANGPQIATPNVTRTGWELHSPLDTDGKPIKSLQQIVADDGGRIWGFGSNLRIFERQEDGRWRHFEIEVPEAYEGWILPKPVYSPTDTAFYIHLTRCEPGWKKPSSPTAVSEGTCHVRIVRVGVGNSR